MQWLGGMGFVVLFLSILPTLSMGGTKILYETEVPGPIKSTLVPRIKETSSILWKTYAGLTVIETVLLYTTNKQMPLLDALCVTFSSLSGGGFGFKNASIAAYNSASTDWIVIIFMTIGAINFSIYFYILKRKIYKIWDTDLLFFLGILFGFSLLITFYINGTTYYTLSGTKENYTFGLSIRHAVFQLVSAQTSTGFATVNYTYWGFFPQLCLFLSMFVGGMPGSTAGGLKTTRYLMLFKILFYKVENIFRPEKIKTIKINKSEMSDPLMLNILIFFSCAMACTLLGVILLIMNGVDAETSLGAIACMTNNVGMAFGAASPVNSFSFLPTFSKIISIIWMILGRLEYFALLFLFIPSFWKSR